METDRGEWKIREAVSRNALTTGLVICAAVIMLAAPCFGVRLACAGVFAAGIVRQKKREALRVQELTVYLERANAGSACSPRWGRTSFPNWKIRFTRR